MGILSGLKPERVFYYFEEICRIPRGSGNMKAISGYIVDFARDKGLDYYIDNALNVIIYKAAHPDCKNSSKVMLQGHMDMVCEKTGDSNHNFMKDPLPIAIMDDFVYSKNTTLGGDDGVAMAYMLAILEDKDIIAPALECVFTTDEEIGMLGAVKLNGDKLSAKYLLNLDSEEEGIFLSSCAGGARADCVVPVRYKEKTGHKYRVTVCGLMGGHSGTEIHKYRGNANIIIGRLLHYLSDRMKFSIVSIQGGLQDNAIPREADVSIIVTKEDTDSFEKIIHSFEAIIKNEYRVNEKNFQIYCEPQGLVTENALTRKTQERVIFLLNTMPDGVQKMSLEIPGLVQTSLNLGIIRMNKEAFSTSSALRSSVASEKQALIDKLRFLTETIGGTFATKGEYPAWEYKDDSVLRPLINRIYYEMTNIVPEFVGIHAGLECGVIADLVPGIDIVSMGPDIFDIHTPRERLSIPSVQLTYDFILRILKELSVEG